MILSNDPEIRRLQKIAVFGLLYKTGATAIDIQRAEQIAEAIEMKFNHMKRIRGILPLDEVELDIARQLNMTPDAYRLWLMDILLEPPSQVEFSKRFAGPPILSQELIDDAAAYAQGTEVAQRAMNRNSDDLVIRKLQRMADFHRDLGQETSAKLLEEAAMPGNTDNLRTLFADDSGAEKRYDFKPAANMILPQVGDMGLKRSTSRPRFVGAGIAGAAMAENIRQEMASASPINGVASGLGKQMSNPPSSGEPAGPSYYNISENDINALFERVESNRAWMESCTKTARHSDPHDAAHLEVMRELSRASKQYINSCRTLIEACDLNAQRPMMAQGAASVPG